MKRCVLISVILLSLVICGSCSEDDNMIDDIAENEKTGENSITEEEKQEFLDFLYGKWQMEPDNSAREIEIYEPNLFRLKGQYPHTIEIVDEVEAKLIPFQNDIRLGAYFKLTRDIDTGEIWAYRYGDHAKETYSKTSYVKVE